MARWLLLITAAVAVGLGVLSSPQVGPMKNVQSFHYPSLPELETNTKLVDMEHLFQGQLAGSESFATGPDGKVYTGLADGRIVRIDPEAVTFELFVRTGDEVDGCGAMHLEHVCGRPLGLRFDGAGNLIVADAYKGLLKVSPSGTITTLLTEVDGTPLVFPNDLDITADGVVYLSDSSSRWQRREVLLEVMEADTIGRLVEYNLATGAARVVADHLPFPNGVSLTHDGTGVLVNTLTRAAIVRYDLASGKTAPFAESLPGTPDNIRRTSRGTYWVALGSKRSKPFALTHLTAPHPWVRRLLVNILGPWRILKLIPSYGLVVEINEDGQIINTLQDPTGRSPWISEVEEVGDHLYLGSFVMPYVGRIPKSVAGY